MPDVFVALVLHQIAGRAADQRASERMPALDQCARSGTDECATRLAVVLPVVRPIVRCVVTMMMTRGCECGIRRHKDGQAEHRRLKFLSEGAHKLIRLLPSSFAR